MAFSKKINVKGGAATTKGDVLFYCLMIALPLIQIGIFYFGVNFQSIMMSFQVYSTSANTFTWNVSRNWELFTKEISTPEFWTMIKDSVIVWFINQLCGTFLALLFSYYIYKNRKWAKFFKFVLFLPSIIPGILLVLIFKYFMNSAMPMFISKLFDVEKSPLGYLNYSDTYFWIVTAYSAWFGFGSQVLVYTGAMEQIPVEMLEAGKLDGVTPFREFISLIVPTILPTITTFVVAGVATIFTNQNSLYAFYGSQLPGIDMTIGYYLYDLVSDAKSMSNYCYASFLGLMSTLIAIPLTFVVRKTLQKVGDK